MWCVYGVYPVKGIKASSNIIIHQRPDGVVGYHVSLTVQITGSDKVLGSSPSLVIFLLVFHFPFHSTITWGYYFLLFFFYLSSEHYDSLLTVLP